MASVKELRDILDGMVNQHYESPEMKRFFAFTMTLAKGRVLFLHQFHFNMNRRDCWGYVQGSCPPEIKRLIWEHESVELVADPNIPGGSHYTASLAKATKLTGLGKEALYQAELIPGCLAAFYGWLHVAKNSPWLKALFASSILERANNNEIVKDGGVSVREYRRYSSELRNVLKDISGHDVHNFEDKEHSDMMEEVLDRYATGEEAQRQVLEGARDSLAMDRAFRGSLGVVLEQIGE